VKFRIKPLILISSSIVSVILSFSDNSFADDFTPCGDFFSQSGQAQIQGVIGIDQLNCMLIVSPTNPKNLIYRSYIFDSTGSFLVFNSLGDGPEATQTGARLFFLFPRSHTLSYKINSNNIQISTNSGEIFTFDANKYGIKSISNSKFSESEEVNTTNNGGVEFLEFPHLLLDAGFMIGNDPRSDHKNNSLISLNEKKCKIKNTEIFDYSNPQEFPLKFKSDIEFNDFIKNRCPGF
jgi:hypothetical protein